MIDCSEWNVMIVHLKSSFTNVSMCMGFKLLTALLERNNPDMLLYYVCYVMRYGRIRDTNAARGENIHQLEVNPSVFHQPRVSRKGSHNIQAVKEFISGIHIAALLRKHQQHTQSRQKGTACMHACMYAHTHDRILLCFHLRQLLHILWRAHWSIIENDFGTCPHCNWEIVNLQVGERRIIGGTQVRAEDSGAWKK